MNHLVKSIIAKKNTYKSNQIQNYYWKPSGKQI